MSSPGLVLVGERDPAKAAHRGIEASLALHRREAGTDLRHEWIATARLTPDTVDPLLGGCTGIWCTPGSPYASMSGALLAIRHARTAGKAFLGTCGGFQHALMEFAQNVLHRDAAHQELTPEAPAPLIVKLSCSLVGATGRVIATRPDRFADLLGGPESVEEFNCNYGVSPHLAGLFAGSALQFVAHDAEGRERAFRLAGHPFFVGTLFQPERRALGGALHPVVRAFFRAL